MARRKKEKTRPVEPPTCSCVLLCDDVIEHKSRPKHDLIGIISTLVLPGLPAIIGGQVVYIRMSNMIVGQSVSIRLHSAENLDGRDTAIFSFNGKFDQENGDRLGVLTMILPVPMFVLEKEGRYILGVYSGNDVLATTPISVHVAKMPLDRGEEE
jgi:hypothetical protein